MIEKLSANRLRKRSTLNFEDFKGEVGLIGQERAEKALSFGLKIKKAGYNIYVSGAGQCGKMSFARKFAEKAAKDEPVPDDLCYVYNFKEPRYPKLIKLPAGMGREFASDMEELATSISDDLKETFSSEEYEDDRRELEKFYKRDREEVIKRVREFAKSKNYSLKTTNSAIYFVPLVDGVPMTDEQFDALTEDEQEKNAAESTRVQEAAFYIMRELRELERFVKKKAEDLEYSTALLCIGRHINKMMKKFGDNKDVLEYLNAVREDMLENVGEYSESVDESDESVQNVIPWAFAQKGEDDGRLKYRVNLFVDNGDRRGAPVFAENKPTFANLAGEVEFESENGNLVTDFMKVKAGLLHKANGGYIILPAYDALTAPHVWETLRQLIKCREVGVDPPREALTGIVVGGVKPEPAKIDVKIILVGASYYYDLLYYYDDDFRKMFKIQAEFDYEMKFNDENERKTGLFIKQYAEENGLPPFSAEAVRVLVEYSSRLAERQDKLSAQFGKLAEIMEEAAIWKKMEGKEGEEEVNAYFTEKAIKERNFRLNMYEEKLSDMIDENTVMIDTEGQKIAQINGLAVIDTGGYIFAKPSRITATTYLGKAGIVNIEKEAEMSGSIHDKGVEVLTGYLGQKYAQNFPLSLSCRICFEQNYSGIDGDSASSTELYTILSSLADVPVKQSFAVTGSINQRGEIQPIGGVTYKIEGFFDLCAKRGLTGEQGVIIPCQNIVDLVLDERVVRAVEEGKFCIFAISHVDDGIELLTGVSAASIHAKVSRKLKNYYKKSMAEE